MVLITGGAGFIGSCLVKLLNENGVNNILIADNLASSDKWKNLVGKQFISYFHKNNIGEYLSKFADDIKVIFHLGACSATTETNLEYLYSNNVDYSIKLYEFAKLRNIPFIYASSAATYGKGELGYSDSISPMDLKPLNGYGFSKNVFDQFLLDNSAFENNVFGLKFFNVFGPNEYHKGDMASMVFKSFNQIKTTGKIHLFKSNNSKFADGGQMRDFVYVKDVVEVMYEIYKNSLSFKAGIYNLGSGVARSWNDLATSVFNAMDSSISINYIDMPDNIKNQYQDFTQADMSQFNSNILNFEFTSLENSISDYVNNHLNQEWQYW